MNCVACKHLNAAERSYCGSCGAALAQYCRFCGFRNLASDRFCGGCGAALGAALSRPVPGGGETRVPGPAPVGAEDALRAELLAAAREAREEVPESGGLHVTQDDIDNLFEG